VASRDPDGCRSARTSSPGGRPESPAHLGPAAGGLERAIAAARTCSPTRPRSVAIGIRRPAPTSL